MVSWRVIDSMLVGVVMLGAAALCADCASPARATPRPWRKVVLVELFTSQGCSSCPAADALVADLPRLGLGRDRVVPLTFHVNYWDDLGWPDPFASPAFTARQRKYASDGRLRAAAGGGSPAGLYTPQMIVDGQVHFSGAQRDVALEQMARAAEADAGFDIEGVARASGDGVAVRVQLHKHERTLSDGDWRVWGALAQKSARTQVHRGENRGETLSEVHIVRALSDAQPLNSGVNTLSLRKPQGVSWDNAEVAVVVQSARTGQVGATITLDILGGQQ